MYSENDEDFGSNEAYKLDEWVFNHVEDFFNQARNDSELEQRLMADKQVFFLHLLGLDTNGHGNKPHSKEYLDNIEVVDRGIERTQKTINEFFNDTSTAFVMTADHGMTDWGSHGAGSDEGGTDPVYRMGSWSAERRRDEYHFSDLTPLLASLIGVAVPVNSMGVLPTQILDVSPNYLFKSSFANFLQARLKEQFLVLREEKAKRLWFQDFDTFGLESVAMLGIRKNECSAKLRRFASCWLRCCEKRRMYIKKAIFHYHRYDRAFLGAAISCCFMAWIALVWCYLTRDRSVPIFTRKTLVPNRIFSGLLVCLAVFCLYCRLPLMNWFYLLLPLFLVSVIENVLNVTLNVYSFIGYCITNYSTVSFTFMLQPFLGLIATSILLFIYVIIFIERRFLAALFVLLTFVPNLYSSKVAEEWKRIWQLMCVVLLPFPFLPNVGKSEIPLLCVGASLLLAIILRKLSRHPLLEKKTNDLYKLSVMLVTTALLIVVSSYLFQKVGIFTPSVRFLCPSISFSHLSDAEFLQLPADQSVDAGCSSRSSRVTGAELRRAVICVSFVLATMFGTGNFASMNSFNPSTLSRFISVFSPFTMATLLVLKIFIPLLMISLLFAAVLRFNHEAIQRLSCLVLIITDLMAMCFFHQLKDDGSWLDIGLSISQYLISMCMSVALLLLLLCASTLMTTTLSRNNIEQIKNVLKGEQNDCLL
ncbi:hypothetical protein COOONC_15672 [Cooperia oncophora]